MLLGRPFPLSLYSAGSTRMAYLSCFLEVSRFEIEMAIEAAQIGLALLCDWLSVCARVPACSVSDCLAVCSPPCFTA